MRTKQVNHGSPGAYAHDRCRCDVCRAGNTLRYRELRARRAANRVVVDGRLVVVDPTVPHGERSTYQNWLCRCPSCTAAQARSSQRRRDELRRRENADASR